MKDCLCFALNPSFLIYDLSTYTLSTEAKDEEVKEQFYDSQERLCDFLPPNDVKILLGDFNAKVGNEEPHRGMTRGHSLYDISNNIGQRFADFANIRNLITKST